MDEYRILTVLLHCPGISRVSAVVENALEDALLSVFRFDEVIEEGIHLGIYTRNLEDQLTYDEEEGWVIFEGNEQEIWNYNCDPATGLKRYEQELNTALRTIATKNKTAIALIQRDHHNAHFVLQKRLPNHWLIAVIGG